MQSGSPEALFHGPDNVKADDRRMNIAEFQQRLAGGKVRCDLCPHHCVPAEGQDGLCRVRGVRNGQLQALCYGMISSAGLDPIEKKPLYHFHPGKKIFSIGGWGCNLACAFCQNWTISQQVGESPVRRPESVIAEALDAGSSGIAYTYNEPLVGFEFVRDCAVAAKKIGRAHV